MDHKDHIILPAGRVATRWFLFLVFFHLLPVPWFIAVTGGLAPAGFLFAIGVAGLFVADFDSLPLAAMFLGPALISDLIFVVLACLLTAGIGRLRKPVAITLSLIIVLAVCIGVALNPIYVSGGHGGGHQFSLLGFFDILGQFRVPSAVSLSYFICLTLLLAGLLVYQHMPQSFPTLPLSRERRRHLLRRSMLGGLILFIALFCWVHRALFFLKPLAEMGVAGAQYGLVTYYENKIHIMRDNPSHGVALLQAAAEQNHLRAMGTLELAWEKGRYGLAQDYQQAQYWYRKLLQAYDSGQYLGAVDKRFITFQRSRLEYVSKAWQFKKDRSRRYEQAAVLERQIMEIEDRYRLEYQKAVNGLNHRDGSREGKKQYRARVEQLRQKYSRQRELEIEKIKPNAAGKH